jgi:hypothetical protein
MNSSVSADADLSDSWGGGTTTRLIEPASHRPQVAVVE